ncbi:MAG TPA: DUF4271 domain-containing protein [Sphingobacteriaceae bacterium]|nr:DUF4271 domain-containing protein [Sphingobacteriaceae bacterium]
MINKLYGILWVLMLVNSCAFAQIDSVIPPSVSKKPTVTRNTYRLDSAGLARRQAYRDSVKNVKDSLKAIGDSLSMVWIKAPDAKRPNLFVDSLLKAYTIKNFDFSAWSTKFKKKANRYDEGKPIPKREPWVLIIIILLMLIFGVLKKAFPNQIDSIIESFYSNRMLTQISKEGNLFSSWPFLFFYILFGFTIAMFLYLSGEYLLIDYDFDGFDWFLILTGIIIGLFTLKIAVLRILAFLFDIGKMVKEYTSILYLSYFNAAIVFLPLVVAFSLTPYRFGSLFSYLALILVAFIFIFQFIRAGALILSNYQFPKVYLFIYLCALEICPLLILLKALRF